MRLNALGYQMIPYWKTPSGTKVITGDPGDTWDGTLPGGDDCLRIAFTHEDAERFCMNRKHTVASMQGVTTEHVALFFTAGAFALAKSVFNQNHVALSRHTKTLTVIGDGSKWASMLKLTETFAIVVDTCIEAPQGPVAVPVPDPDFLKLIEPPAQKILQPGSDSHLTTDLIKDGGTEDPTFSCPQDLAPFGIKGNFDPFSHASLNVQNYQSMINKRGHPVDFNREFYRRNPCAHANTFTETPANALLSLSARYAGVPRATGAEAARLDALRDPTTRDDAPAQPDEDKLARAIVRQFSERHFKDTLNTSAFSENNLTLIRANITTRAAIQKGYALRLEAADTDRHQRDVVFSSKSHVKAKSPWQFNGLKAAQGISAWSPSMMVSVMVATRAMSQHFVRNCKPHVVFDLEKPTDVFLAEVEELLQNTPGYEDIVTDQEEFDANQNVWTQKVERLFWEHLRIPVEILERHGEALLRGTGF